MEPYFDKLPNGNGQAEKQKQFKAIFPAGIPQQKPYDFNSLIEAISASPADEIEAVVIRKESNDTAICKALEAFRKNFTDLAMKEMFFNPLHLIKAFNIYDRRLDTWSRSQGDLFWDQIIGYIQSFLPACFTLGLVGSCVRGGSEDGRWFVSIRRGFALEFLDQLCRANTADLLRLEHRL